MTPDHYATLGLSPTSEDVVIRAAYRALVRRYHPDGNASAAATARTRAINAAYEVLIDPEKRAQYDQLRAAKAWPSRARRRSMLPAPSRLFAAACVTVLLVLVFLISWPNLSLVRPAEGVTRVPTRAPAAMAIPILPPAEEMAAAPIAVERQVADPQLDEPVPEPPKTAVATPANPIIAKAARPRSSINKPELPEILASFSCRSPRTRGESLVCGDANLANLDRQQALFYGQSWLGADAAKRVQLQATRDRFMARRDGCGSIACARTAYLARMREVSAIMIGPVKLDRMAP